MKRLYYGLFGFMVAALVFIANMSSASACAVFQYQPEVPEALRK